MSKTERNIGVFMKRSKRYSQLLLGQPPKVATTNEIVKYIADEGSGYIVERCRRRQVVCAYKDDRKVGILEHIHSELFM